jgi:DHA1 family tetracycline resistance protein-like MFS transporter
MFGLGFVLGPVLGGLLGDPNLRLPFFAAAGMCAVNWLYGLLVLPESLPPDRRSPMAHKRLNPFSSLAGLARLRGVGPLVFAVAADLLAQLMLQSVWVLYTGLRFHWGPRENGFSLFVVGMVAVVVQGGLLRRLLKSMGERALIVAGFGSGAIAYAAYGLVPQGGMLYFVIIANFLVFASGTALQGVISKAADAHEQGRTMATLTSLRSVLGIVASTLGPLLLGQVSHLPPDNVLIGTPFFACCLFELLAFLIARQYFARHPRPANLAASGGAA